MTANDFLAYAELSMLLMGSDMEKIFCPSTRGNKYGKTTVSCTHGIGHLGPHHDAHAARSWED